MSHLVYVDCSNLLIEAQKLSGISRGMARDLVDAADRRVIDVDYRMDVYRLMSFLEQAGQPAVAAAFGSITEANGGFWNHVRKAGFEAIVVERNQSGRESRVDTALVARACRDAYLRGNPRLDWITLVAGDGDYVPMVDQLRHDGFDVTVACWSHASRDLRQAASRFYCMDPLLHQLEVRQACHPVLEGTPSSFSAGAAGARWHPRGSSAA